MAIFVQISFDNTCMVESENICVLFTQLNMKLGLYIFFVRCSCVDDFLQCFGG